MLYELDPEDPLYRYSFVFQAPDPTGLTSIDDKEWLRPHMMDLCKNLVEQFPWIDNHDYEKQINNGDLSEFLLP